MSQSSSDDDNSDNAPQQETRISVGDTLKTLPRWRHRDRVFVLKGFKRVLWRHFFVLCCVVEFSNERAMHAQACSCRPVQPSTTIASSRCRTCDWPTRACATCAANGACSKYRPASLVRLRGSSTSRCRAVRGFESWRTCVVLFLNSLRLTYAHMLDGYLYVATPVDPLFLLVPRLEALRNKVALYLNQSLLSL